MSGTPYKTYCRPTRFNGNSLLHSSASDLVGTKYSTVYCTVSLKPSKVATSSVVDESTASDDEEDAASDDDDSDTTVEALSDLSLEDDFEDSSSCLLDED